MSRRTPQVPGSPRSERGFAEHVRSENICTWDLTGPRTIKGSTEQKVGKLGCPRNLGCVPGTVLDRRLGKWEGWVWAHPEGPATWSRRDRRGSGLARAPTQAPASSEIIHSFIHSSWSLPAPPPTLLGTEPGLTGREGALPLTSAFHLPDQAVSPGWVSLTGTHAAEGHDSLPCT